MTFLSVVIPTYRKPQELRRTLAALEPQVASVPGGCEVVVVDDGSGDETSSVLRRFESTLPLGVQRPPCNEGRARARNRGWRNAAGEVVLFLDDDIVLEPGALAAHAAAHRARRGAYLGEVMTDPEIVDSPLFEYLDSRGIAKLPPGGRVPARYFLTQNASVPRDALETVGGFDETFGGYGFEDTELAFRLEDEAQLAFFSLQGARGHHVHHHSLKEYLQKKRICGRRSLRRLAARHPQRLREMRLQALPGMGGPCSRSERRLRRLLAASLTLGVPALAAGILGRWPRCLSRRLRHRLYDYLVVASYVEGLRQPDSD